MGNQPKDFIEQDDYYPTLIAVGQQYKPHLFLNFYQLSVKSATQRFCVRQIFCGSVCKTKEGSSRTQVAIKKRLQDAKWRTKSQLQ